METTRHLEILRLEGARLAAMPADALDAPVPSVPGWTLERVVRHTGKVHRWCADLLGLGPAGDPATMAPTPGLPHGPDCLAAYAEAHAALVDRFEQLDPATGAASFIGPADAAWWARRQAHEVTVHRVDAADAVHGAGGAAPDPLEADAAADGIDEWARVFLGTRWGQRFGAFPADLLGRTVHVHGTDDPAPADGAEWLFTFGPEGLEVAATHAKGDVALRGPAPDLFLTLWRRRPLATVDVVGDAAVADALLEIATF